MTIINAILLGLIQGLTEFLPVSSSGHLAVFQNIFGFHESLVAFDVFLHLGTLSAVIVFFWQDILQLKKNDFFLLGIGTLPAVGIGLLLAGVIGDLFASGILVGAALIGTGVLNTMTDKMLNATDRKSHQVVTRDNAIKVGLWQALAIVPGISRSGATVFGGVKVGLERQAAFKFSFLLSVPAILAAAIYQGLSIYSSSEFSVSWIPTILGVATAFITGFFCLKLLQYLVKEAKLRFFGWYCFLVGSLVIILSIPFFS